MATATELRKHAEKIQREVLQTRLGAAQPLIDDLSKRETLTENAAALQTELTTLDISIGVHHHAALDGGWTTDELASANLGVPKSAPRKRATKPRKAATSPSPAPAVGDQPDHEASRAG